MKQRLAILGSTGSIGTSTLDVVARHPDRFEVFALTAGTRVDLMFEQCVRWRPALAVMAEAAAAQVLADRLVAHGIGTRVLSGAAAIAAVAAHESVDVVMAAIVGAAGLAPCLAAAQAGKRLLLANKEALVVGGQLFMDTVRAGGATLLPIDSEHSAVFQSLPEDSSTWARRIDRIILTASGGPFRTRDPATLAAVTPEEACAHPNFSMGRKISVDSATMMNKGLEVIEARWLFDVAPGQIEVVIHPQQIVHSMVQYHDASVVAQLGTPDMRVPIAYGLSWPERIESGAGRLDFGRLAAMTFEAPDERRFPCLPLAWAAMRGPEGSTTVLNAANEVAVAAFLERRIPYDRIPGVIAETLAAARFSKPDSLEALLAVDVQARELASAALGRLKGQVV